MSDIFSSQTKHLVFRSPGIGLIDVDIYGNMTVHSDETTLREALIVEGNTKLIGRTSSTSPEDNALEVEGDTIITSLNVGKPGLTVHGDNLLDGNLEVNLDTVLHGNLTVDFDTNLLGHLTVDLDTVLKGTLLVQGDTTLDGLLTVNNDAHITGNLTVDTHTTLNTLTAQGDAVFDQTVLISGDLTVRGDVTIIGSGEQVIENQKSLAIDDPLLYLNFGVLDIADDPESKGVIIDRGLYSIITVDDGTNTLPTVERVNYENGKWVIKLDGSGMPVWRDDPTYSHHGQTLTVDVINSGTYPAPTPNAVTDPASVVWAETGGENNTGTWLLNWALQDRRSLSPDGGTTAPALLPTLPAINRTLRGLDTPLTLPGIDYAVNVEYLTQETDKINDRITNLTLDDLFDVQATDPDLDNVIYYDPGTVEWVAREFEIIRDRTPELGGNLDVKNHSIVSNGSNSIKLSPNIDVYTGSINLIGSANTETISTSTGATLVISPAANLKLNAVFWPKNAGAVDQILALDNNNTLVWKNTVHSLVAGEGLSSELGKTTGDMILHVNVGTGLSITSDVVVHNTVPQQLDTNNTNGVVIQNLTFDVNRLGHVIELETVDLDGRYTPTIDADAKYVLKEGDVMTGDLEAPNFIGHLQGNADTATQWAATKSITLIGEVTSDVIDFDGSGNITLNTIVTDYSHQHEIADVDGLQEILDDISTAPSAVYVSDVPPPNAIPSTLWYDTVSGILYIYYQDVDSLQWVEASPQGTPEDILRDELALPTGATLVGTASGNNVQVELNNKVPITRRINTHALNADINLTSADVGAVNAQNGVAPYAARLQTARTISLMGDVTGSIPFDGSQNVSLDATIVVDGHVHNISSINGLQAALDGKLPTNGNAVSASTAAKLTTARTITLTGDVTGSVSFDGTANVSLAAVVVDDLHNHTIANVDNLQTTLDGKVDLVGDTMTGNLTTPKVIMTATQGTGGGDAVRYDYLNAQTPVRGIDLGAGQDLNNYQTAGFYYQDSDADAASGSNYPVDKSGSLLVQKAAGITQLYIAYGNNYACYTRGFYSGTWSAWSRFYTTNYKPTYTATEVGAIPVQTAGSVMEAGKYIDFHDTGTSVDYSARITVAGSELQFSNNISAGDVYIRSDARLKSNIVTIDSALDKVNKLSGCTYDKKLDLSSTETRREAGVIAQHLQKVLPEAVSISGENELLTISSAGVNALLIEAIKELTVQVDELKAKLAKLGEQ